MGTTYPVIPSHGQHVYQNIGCAIFLLDTDLWIQLESRSLVQRTTDGPCSKWPCANVKVTEGRCQPLPPVYSVHWPGNQPIAEYHFERRCGGYMWDSVFSSGSEDRQPAAGGGLQYPV